ncbi:enoyl-CoA hydratase [Lysobacter fragariae]
MSNRAAARPSPHNETPARVNAYESIQFDSTGGIARLTLNQPKRLNSLDTNMSLEIIAALAHVANDPDVRVLLITGSGRGFCAGANLTSLSSDGAVPDLGEVLEDHYNPIVETLRGLHVPVLCAVNGVAAGAGANFALACDVVIATRSASFLQAFAKVGLLPDMGGTWFLPHLIGPARAMALSLLAEPISAEQAEQWGMIWRCVDDDQFADATEALLQRLALAPPQAALRTKKAIHAATANTLTDQLALERDYQRELGRTADFLEGVSAFMEKRSPRFSGR